jgi:radical SAM superfamily enzyme YgiQ (UPF0313 family)
MRVLLLKPPEIPYPTEPSLGLAYIAAMAEKEHIVSILDASVEKLSFNETIQRIKEFKPDVVGVQVLTPSINQSKKICKMIRKEINCFIVIGGPHPTIMPEKALKEIECDVAVIGEGEITFIELLKTIEKNGELSKVKGIAFKEKNGKIVCTEKRELIKNLDEVPFPARHLMKNELYEGSQNTYLKPFTTVFTARGCPYECAFCSVRVVWGRTNRQRSPENVLKECIEVYEKFGIREIFFNDDIFTLRKSWVMEFCEKLIDSGINFSWKCLSRVNLVDKEVLSIMRKAGCHTIAYGIESGNQKILERVNKKTTLEQVRKAVNLTKKADIDVWAFFIIGAPGEGINEMLDTFNLAKELNPDSLSFSIASPLPGTEFYKIALEKGLLEKNFDWGLLDYYNKVAVSFEGISPEKLIKIQQSFYDGFYGRLEFFIENILLKSIKRKSFLGSKEKLKNFLKHSKNRVINFVLNQGFIEA